MHTGEHAGQGRRAVCLTMDVGSCFRHFQTKQRHLQGLPSSPAAFASPLQCQPGTFSNATAAAACAACPPGWTTPPAGTGGASGSGVGPTGCTPCPAGTWKPAGAADNKCRRHGGRVAGCAPDLGERGLPRAGTGRCQPAPPGLEPARPPPDLLPPCHPAAARLGLRRDWMAPGRAPVPHASLAPLHNCQTPRCAAHAPRPRTPPIQVRQRSCHRPGKHVAGHMTW